MLISDDGSTDDTLEILGAYGGKVQVVNSKRVGGVVPNFERALSVATRELIVLCDQDDVWLPGRLDVVRRSLRSGDLVMMDGEVVDSDLRPIGQSIHEFVNFRGGFFRNFVSNSYVGCCMAFRREILDVALPFPERIQWHDWYLALIGEVLFSPKVSAARTMLFRRHDANASNTGQRSSRGFLKKMASRFWMARLFLWRRCDMDACGARGRRGSLDRVFYFD